MYNFCPVNSHDKIVIINKGRISFSIYTLLSLENIIVRPKIINRLIKGRIHDIRTDI